jgi:hypothetical protein
VTAPDPGWEAYMDGQAEAQADVFEASAGEAERDALLAEAELIVRDACLRAAAEPKVYPALYEPEAEL